MPASGHIDRILRKASERSTRNRVGIHVWKTDVASRARISSGNIRRIPLVNVPRLRSRHSFPESVVVDRCNSVNSYRAHAPNAQSARGISPASRHARAGARLVSRTLIGTCREHNAADAPSPPCLSRRPTTRISRIPALASSLGSRAVVAPRTGIRTQGSHHAVGRVVSKRGPSIGRSGETTSRRSSTITTPKNQHSYDND
jgi:hypothetical protein